MRAFASPKYTITRASSNLRLVLSLFLVVTLLGLATNLTMTYRQTGFSAEGVASYYRGEEDSSGEILAYPKSTNELLMNSHFHLFMMPLLLLVLCHVFYMATVPERLKEAITWVAFSSLLGEIGAPWLVRFVAAEFAYLMVFSNLLLSASILLLIGTPMYELWLKPRQIVENNGAP
jgi:hypothetical protein